MSKIGLYRYKFAPQQDITVSLFVNYVLTSSKQVIVKDWCEGDKKIKFLNKDGQYRYIAFNRFYEGSDKPKELGRANKTILSLLSSQASENSVGYKNDRTINLRSDHVSQEELAIIKDVYTSPRVFYYVGDGTTDVENDWIQVSVKAKNPITNIRKGSFTDVIIDITLPEHYTINML